MTVPSKILGWVILRIHPLARPSALLMGACLIAGAPSVQAFNYGFLGTSVLAKLTPADVEIGSRVTREALDSGEDREWQNPATGARGTIRILGTVDVPNHKDCRRTRLDVVAGGRSGGGNYTLCRTKSGSWNFYTPPRST
jgi:surface antigen